VDSLIRLWLRLVHHHGHGSSAGGGDERPIMGLPNVLLMPEVMAVEWEAGRRGIAQLVPGIAIAEVVGSMSCHCSGAGG
jgi:hypothetical protein